MVCRYVDDEGDVTEHYSVRAMERQRHVRRRKASTFRTQLIENILLNLDKKYSTNLLSTRYTDETERCREE